MQHTHCQKYCFFTLKNKSITVQKTRWVTFAFFVHVNFVPHNNGLHAYCAINIKRTHKKVEINKKQSQMFLFAKMLLIILHVTIFLLCNCYNLFHFFVRSKNAVVYFLLLHPVHRTLWLVYVSFFKRQKDYDLYNMYRSLKDKKTDLYVTFHFIQNVQHTHCQKVPVFLNGKTKAWLVMSDYMHAFLKGKAWCIVVL